MSSHRRKHIQIKIEGEVVEINDETVKFYLKETQRSVPRKQAIEKFYTNMLRLFTAHDIPSVE